MSNIVVIIDPGKEAELRSGGVLPPGMFRSFDEIRPDGTPPDDHSVYIWPYPVDYSKGSDSDEPVSLPAMMGLPETGDEELASESYIARLFGSDVFHVVFLETDDGESTAGAGFTGRKSTFGSLEEVAKWSTRLRTAIEGRLSREQAKLIRHHLVLVASGGQVVTTKKAAEELDETLRENPSLRGCYFLDFNLEVEQNNLLMHSKYVWPIMVGRLLLRFLLENTQGTGDAAVPPADMAGADANAETDSVRLPGIHLWQAREFLFGYPTDQLGKHWAASLKKAYKAVSESTSITQTVGSGGKLFNGKDPELQAFFQDPGGPERVVPERPPRLEVPGGSWDDAKVDPCVAWAHNDSRWAKVAQAAAEQFQKVLFALSHRAWLPADKSGTAVYHSPQALLTKKIFRAVDGNPAQVFFKANELEVKLGQKAATDNPFTEWRKALEAEKKREEAKRAAAEAGKEMKAAQGHFVPHDLGILAVGSITLFCGSAIWLVGRALGASFGLSLMFASFVLLGALAAHLFVHWRHGARGREGLEAFVGMCNDVDEWMDRRNSHLFATVDAASKFRELSERRNAMAGNLERLRRVRRILDREIQIPAVSVFFLEDETARKVPPAGEGKRQRELLNSRTVHLEDVLGSADFTVADAKSAALEIESHFPDAPETRSEGRFFKAWGEWCRETNQGHWGNYPARYFIPKLRAYMQGLCDRVAVCLKNDVLDKRKERLRATGELPEVLRKRMELRTGDFTYASAHVDFEQQDELQGSEVLYIAPRFREEGEDGLQTGDLVVRVSRTFGVLPHYAFYYRDIPVHLGCEKSEGKGRLAFCQERGA